MGLRQPVTRRRLMWGAGALATAATIDAVAIEPAWLDVHRMRVPIEGLPRSLEGFTVAQVTDAHITGLGHVENEVLEALTRVSPQLVVLTGDLIDSLDHARPLAELCAELSRVAPHVIATLGNWEHWGRVERTGLDSLYRRSGARLAVEEWITTEGLSIYASDDSTGGTPQPIERPATQVGPRVLLTHSPAFVDRHSGDFDFDLCLAGHTHGGQITVAGFAPVTPPGSGRFVAGWYETPAGRLYVSRGTGTSIVPARFMCRPELPLRAHARLTRSPRRRRFPSKDARMSFAASDRRSPWSWRVHRQLSAQLPGRPEAASFGSFADTRRTV